MSQLQYAHDVSVYIGRFQPFHLGHLAVLNKALTLAPVCVVVLGSAHQAPSFKNPFTWQERAHMITQALPKQKQKKLRFLPMPDVGNESVWVRAVRTGVEQAVLDLSTSQALRFILVGHVKDDSSHYLEQFSGWSLQPMPRMSAADGTALRHILFEQSRTGLAATLQALEPWVPVSTLNFLQTWLPGPSFNDGPN
jgi:bifunctional NMN adenylyltransferase/nudix hydrolase